MCSLPSPLRINDPGRYRTAAFATWLADLTLQLANPKVLVFFLAILPWFVDARLPVPSQMIWLAAGSMIPEFFTLAACGWLGARAAHLVDDPVFALWTERVAGTLVLVVVALIVRTASG